MNSCRILLLILLIRQTIMAAGKSSLAIFLLNQGREEEAEREVENGCNYHSQRPNDGEKIRGTDWNMKVGVDLAGKSGKVWNKCESKRHDGAPVEPGGIPVLAAPMTVEGGDF